MNSPLDNALNPKSYVLSRPQFLDLCVVCDKLMLLAQLTGNATTVGEEKAMLITRALLGQLFADMSFQMRDVLQAVDHSKTSADVSSTH